MAKTSDSKRFSEDLRKTILQKRAQVSLNQWKDLGRSGIQRVLGSRYGSRLLNQPRVLLGMYSALADEPSLEILEELAVQESKIHLFYPRIESVKEKKMSLVKMPSRMNAEDWVAGAYGIREPHPSQAAADEEMLQALDLIFVPSVVLGERGERWGRGAGYYDRFLPLLPQAIRVTFAFEFQLVQELKQEAWDQGVDWIFTESREIQGPQFLEKWKLILK